MVLERNFKNEKSSNWIRETETYRKFQWKTPFIGFISRFLCVGIFHQLISDFHREIDIIFTQRRTKSSILLLEQKIILILLLRTKAHYSLLSRIASIERKVTHQFWKGPAVTSFSKFLAVFNKKYKGSIPSTLFW